MRIRCLENGKESHVVYDEDNEIFLVEGYAKKDIVFRIEELERHFLKGEISIIEDKNNTFKRVFGELTL